MRYRVLESGAIACSAIAISGWISSPNADSTLVCYEPSASTLANSQAAQPDCKLVPSVAQASILPSYLFQWGWGGDRGTRDIEQIYEKLFVQAQELANRDRLSAALLELGGIPKNSQHFSSAQQLQREWGQELLQQATQEYRQARLLQAVTVLKQIPVSCPLFQEAQTLAQQWQSEAAVLQQAQYAAKAKRWSDVIQILKQLENSPLYQSNLVQASLQVATHQSYTLDQTLINTASSTTNSAANLPIQVPNLPASELAIADLPNLPPLAIETATALTWTQPKKPPKVADANRSQSHSNTSNQVSNTAPSAPLFPVNQPEVTAVKQPPQSAIAPPETLPVVE